MSGNQSAARNGGGPARTAGRQKRPVTRKTMRGLDVPLVRGSDKWDGFIIYTDRKTGKEVMPVLEEAKKKPTVPISEKWLLTVDEAAAYTNIGVNKLREMAQGKNCDFCLYNGKKLMLKRKMLEAYLDRQYSI